MTKQTAKDKEKKNTVICLYFVFGGGGEMLV